jgi:uncharacterized membrane protein YhdT
LIDSTLWWIRYKQQLGTKTSIMVTSDQPVTPYPFADLPGVIGGEGNIEIWFEVKNIFLRLILKTIVSVSINILFSFL